MPELTPEVERELAALDDALAGRRVAADLTELGELALALRDERQRPEESFGAELDAKVERGFRDPGPRRASEPPWWRVLLSGPALGTAAAIALVVVLVVAAPNGRDDEGEAGGGSSAQTESFDGGGGGSAASAMEESAGKAAQEPAPAA